MKKVLIVTNNMLGGGAEKVLLHILKNIDRTKFQIDLLLIEKRGIRFNEIPQDIKVDWIFDENNLHKKLPKNPKSLKSLYDKHVKKIYDVEIAFLEGPPTLFLANSPNKNSKKIAWVHVDLAAFPWTAYLYNSVEEERTTYTKFDNIVFVSKTNLDAFSKKFNINSNLLLLYNPINTDEVLYESGLYDVDEKRFMFCYVSSISKRKGQDKLIFALKRLIDEGYDCCLYLIGEGDIREDLILLSENLGVRHRVIFTGYHKNPYPFIKAADVFVHASDSEGYPTVLCESLTLQTPVIATKCSGSIDVLNNGEFGLLTDISIEGLYSGMKELLLSEQKRKYFAHQGIVWSNQYSFKKCLQNIENLIDS